jgi:hypothetical protein
VSLDADLIQKCFGGTKPSHEDQARFETHPGARYAPSRRHSKVRGDCLDDRSIGQQLRLEIPTQVPGLPEACVKETVLGAKVLKLAVAFDHLRMKLSDPEAINHRGTQRTESERELVDVLIGKAIGGGMEARTVST